MRGKKMRVGLIGMLFLLLGGCGSGSPTENSDAADSSQSVQSADTADFSGSAQNSDTEQSQSAAVKTEADADYGISNLPLGMYMSVTSVKDGVAEVLFDNQSGYEMTYSEYFSLQKEVDGEWEIVPAKEDAVVRDIAYVLKDLETGTYELDLKAYFGNLEAGNYRLIQDDMVTGFSLSEALK